jgi:hypothetical protein
MDVLILTVFVSAVLVVSAVLFFGWNVLNRTHEHDDRLTLLPLQDEQTTPGTEPHASEQSEPRGGVGP